MINWLKLKVHKNIDDKKNDINKNSKNDMSIEEAINSMISYKI